MNHVRSQFPVWGTVVDIDAATWFPQAELAGYQVWAIDRHENTSWSI